ncbi:hypothetical protein ACH5RR_007666 [Cinchona calisaya]|uniref:Uncharacterized protein n=1 Tax=Cinchona calisaya TaxID=153742 RepID=A0ABD3A9D0_9GENT
MSLLETITKAASSVPSCPDYDLDYPLVLNPEPVFLNLKPEDEDPIDQVAVKRANGWQISKTDSDAIELGRSFFNKLKRKLKNTNSFTKGEFLEMFNSFLEKNGEKFGIPVRFDKLEGGYTVKLVEKVGFFMGRDVRSLLLEACFVLELWDVLESLIVNELVLHSCVSNLVNNLIEKRKSDLLVLCVKHLGDIQTYDIVSILRYFLCPSKEGYESMVSVRKEWESQALLAVEKVSDKSLSGKKISVAREASLLIMAAYDGFSVSELCLHYLLKSKNVDELILATCISKLNGSEMMSLIRYLGKWLKKYERFPQVSPCPKASSLLGLKVCEWIPSLEDVVKCLGLVVDEHFSSLVLHPEFHEELRSLGGLASSLAAEARLCGSLANLADSLRSDHRGIKDH